MNYKDQFIYKVKYMISILLSVGVLLLTPPVNPVAMAAGPDSVAVKNNCVFTPFVINPVPGLMNHEDAIRAGLLYDVDRNVVIWQKDMNYAYPVASLTKMMVALLAMEDIKSGKANWADEIKVTRVFYKGSRRHKKKYTVEQQYSLEDLMKLAMVNSNNEATVWLGKKLAGGELEPFIKRMNEKCIALGMEHTFYSNPSGLPAVSGELDNSSSPNDLLILALELIKHQEILQITSQGYVNINQQHKNYAYRNHNGLVIQYPNEVDGLKTGYTKNARFCLVATANRGGHRLISIVLGAKSPYHRNELVAEMMNNYYSLLGFGSLGSPVIDSTMAKNIADSLNNSIAYKTGNFSYNTDSNFQNFRTVYVKSKKIHTVKKGETLYGIADKYDCFASELKKWNRLKSVHLKAGQKMVVYQTTAKRIAINSNGSDSSISAAEVAKDKQDSAKTKVTAKAKSTKNTTDSKESALKGKFVYHIVQPGDTLWNIAQKYAGTTVEKIKKTNKIYNNKNLRPGTKLKIQVTS